MTTNAKLNPKEIRDDKFEEKAHLKAVEERIYQTMEVSALLTQITEHEKRVEQLKKQIKEIEVKSQDDRETSLKATMKLQKDLEAKIGSYEELNEELLRTKKEYEEKLVKLAAQKDDEINGLKSEIYNSKFELNKKINELNDELRTLKEFKENREEYFSTMESSKKKVDELIIRHNDDLRRIDNQTKKALQMQDEKYKKDINQIRHEAKKEAEMEVEKLERKVIEDNKKLRQDLIEYKREIEVLKKEKERFLEESKQVKQNISLQEDSAIEYQAIHFRQESKIKKLKEKVQVLKNYIAQEVNKHTKEIEAAKYQYQSRIVELELENKTLRDELKFRTKETKNLKTLSQIILDQRSEIEEFFIETFEQIKEEARKQKSAERKTKLPEINSKSKFDLKPKKSWEKVDFAYLDWEDKEKILRILFSKMNSGMLPPNWRSGSFEKNSDVTSPSQDGLQPQYFSANPRAPREEIKG